MKEFYLDSCGGGRLHCAIWTPEGEPKAVVQLIHGIAEHIGRYDDFARFLNSHGYVVAADDHMGHGGSVENGVKGYFSGGWLSAVEDEKRLHDEIAAQYPALPYFILGHSMGSFLLRTYLYTYPDAVDKAVISGTGWEDPTKVRLGKLVCRLEQARVGETSTSKLVTKLMFGSYNKSFGAVTSPNAWICSDEAVVAAYDADPLCGFDATVGLARDLLTGVEMNEQPENLDKMNKQLPLLFVSRQQGPGRRYGQGRAALHRRVQAQRHEGYHHQALSRGPPRDAQRAQQGRGLSGHSRLAGALSVPRHTKGCNL